jgi:hypothetical protein
MYKKIFLVCVFVIIYTIYKATNLWSEDCNRKHNIVKKQNLKNTSAMIDVNNIAMGISNDGLFAVDPESGCCRLEYPKGSGKTLIYSAGPWVVGKMNNEFRTAAAMYSTEFRPGMIQSDGNPDDPTLEKYCVYKVNKGELVPQEVIDQGGPSEVLGDQMLYTVFNDADPLPHTAVWQTEPIRLEVHLLVWAYENQIEAFNNTVFLQYDFINKNTLPLQEAYVGFFFDVDIGEATDDWVGCDPSQNVGYGYNGMLVDDVYGKEVPCIGCDLLQGPLIASPGDTVRFLDGRIFPDFKHLEMTAFVRYI